MELLITIMMLLSILFFLIFLRDKNDIFSPRNLLPIFYLIKIIPSMLYISIKGVPLHINKPLIYEAITSSDAFIKYGLLQLISFIGMMTVINITLLKMKINSKPISCSSPKDEINNNQQKCMRLKLWGSFFLLVSFIAFVINIQSVGGLLYFLNNLQYRTILLRDQDILVWVSSLIVYAPLLFIYSKKYNISDKKISIFLWILLIFSGLIGGMGGRKYILFIIFYALFIYNYSVKKVNISRILSIRNILIACIVAFIFALLPMLRMHGRFDYMIQNPIEIITLAISNISMLFVNESYVPFYITVVHYFNSSNMWYGASFLGLLTAFIPSSLYPLKAPVDDGMYLYSIILGRTDVYPVMPTSGLNLSSYPLETFGSMYANFGFLGVILGMLLLGSIISKTYRYMQKKNNLFSILLYSNVVLNLELSTLRIVQLMFSILLVYIVSFTSEKVKI
jgi:oligosaccharide repeat unit polymerase